MDRNKELKVHRLRLPGRSLCSIRSNRKWCKRRGSSLECQNCFFVYPIIDSNLKNLLSSSLYFIDYRKDSVFYETCRLGTACNARCPQMASTQKGSWRQPAQGKRSVPCMIWSRPWLRKITALRRGAFGERNAPTSGWCIIAPLVN